MKYKLITSRVENYGYQYELFVKKENGFKSLKITDDWQEMKTFCFSLGMSQSDIDTLMSYSEVL